MAICITHSYHLPILRRHWIDTCRNTCPCTCTYVYVRTCTYTYMYMYMYIYVYVHIRTCTYTYMYMYVHVHMYKYICTCTCTYVYNVLIKALLETRLLGFYSRMLHVVTHRKVQHPSILTDN